MIFDEAHLIEDIAADYFGFQISSFQIDELARDADNLPITDAIATRDMTKIVAKIIGLADQFWIQISIKDADKKADFLLQPGHVCQTKPRR